MKNPLTLFAFLAITIAGIPGCGTSNPVVATIGGDAITLKEYEESYARNNGGWEAGQRASLEERQRFLDLIVKFRLKVREARSRDLLRDSSVRAEIRGYESSVAQTYVIDKELVEPNLKVLYDRKKSLIRASHILIRVADHAPPEDTLRAWVKAKSVIEKLATGSFDSLAILYSEDQSVNFNKGDLGFFTTGRMVAPFEDAAFALPTGAITPVPARSQFGYHVIKVTERQPNAGAVSIAHILLRFPAPNDTASVHDTLQSVLAQLAAGIPFETLTYRYSQDEGSKLSGGDIGEYERDRLPPDLADLLFSTPAGGVTRPYAAQYGVHIFKVKGFTGVPPYATAERDLRQQYQQMRYQHDYDQFLAGLRTKYGVNIDDGVIVRLAAALDSTMTPADSTWDRVSDAGLRAAVVLTVGTGRITLDSMLIRLGSSPEFRNQRLTLASLRSTADRLAESMVLDLHASTAADRHPAFAKLMEEYREGILLYRIEQDEVWQKVTVNDSLLRLYWEPRKNEYRWPERTNFAEIYVTSDSLAKVAIRRAKAGADFLALAEQMTMRAGYRDKKGVWGFQARTFNDLAARAASMVVDSIDGPFPYGAGFSIIKVLEKDTARTKTFEEAAPEVTSGYQEQASKDREAAWVEQLRSRYGVITNADALKQAFTRKPDATE